MFAAHAFSIRIFININERNEGSKEDEDEMLPQNAQIKKTTSIGIKKWIFFIYSFSSREQQQQATKRIASDFIAFYLLFYCEPILIKQESKKVKHEVGRPGWNEIHHSTHEENQKVF